MGTMQDFARRQPVAFFGAAVLAGFAIARFAKSTAQPEGLYDARGMQGGYGDGSYGDGQLRQRWQLRCDQHHQHAGHQLRRRG
jgi:hypothetical protein